MQRRLSNYKLNRENAIIKNISKKNLFEAELIAKKDLVPKESALMQAYREKQSLESPLYKTGQAQLKAILDKPSIDYNNLSNALVNAIQNVEETREPRVDFPIEEVVEEPEDPKEPPSTWHTINKNTFMEVDAKTKDDLNEMNDDQLAAYVDKYKRELSRFLNHMTNTRVTDAMKQHNSYDWHHNALQKTILFDRFLDNYYVWRQNQQEGTSIMTNLGDLLERFKILYGEITSGNKNTQLINEFRDIIYYLYKNKYIKRDAYNTLMLEIQ